MPTVGSRGSASTCASLAVANSRLHRLLPWAVVSATVSLILNQLERHGIVGRIIASLIGLAWSLITFLTIPILVLEDVGVVDAFKRSGVLFKKTWGENVAGQAGLGIVGFVAAIPGIALIAIGAAVGTAGLVLLGGIGVIWLVVSATVVVAAERHLPHRVVPLRGQRERARRLRRHRLPGRVRARREIGRRSGPVEQLER